MSVSANSGGRSLRELKRRRVVKTVLYYAGVSAMLLLISGVALPAMGIHSEGAFKMLLSALVLGFPVACVLAWHFRLTPDGVVRAPTFVERRMLRNMAPINDRRHASREGESVAVEHSYRWVIAAETGPLAGLLFGISDTVVVGRALGCDIAVVSPELDDRHARFSIDGDELLVEDISGGQRVSVNGAAIQQRQSLNDGDEVRLQNVVFRVKLQGAA